MVILLALASCFSAATGEPACYFKMVISVILSKASKSVEAASTLLPRSCLLIDGFKCSFKRFCKNCMVLYSLLWAATYRFRKSASLSRPRLCTKSSGWLLLVGGSWCLLIYSMYFTVIFFVSCFHKPVMHMNFERGMALCHLLSVRSIEVNCSWRCLVNSDEPCILKEAWTRTLDPASTLLNSHL